jgi:hypothetical protein
MLGKKQSPLNKRKDLKGICVVAVLLWCRCGVISFRIPLFLSQDWLFVEETLGARVCSTSTYWTTDSIREHYRGDQLRRSGDGKKRPDGDRNRDDGADCDRLRPTALYPYVISALSKRLEGTDY